MRRGQPAIPSRMTSRRSSGPSAIDDKVGAVDEHKLAVVQLNRPPSRRVSDVVSPNVDSVACCVSEVFDDDAPRFSFGVWVYLHSLIRGNVFAVTFTQPSHLAYPRCSQSNDQFRWSGVGFAFVATF
jgi:hypothetical protein